MADFTLPGKGEIHFIGIGGISMSGLAHILLENGYEVSGSDICASHLTENLKAEGARIHIGHRAQNIKSPALVVYSAAIKEDNPELLAARQGGFLAISRAVLLGAIMKRYRCPITVAGTHGKTTTTAMLAEVLLAAGLDPTVSIGGELGAIGGNIHVGKSEYFLTEACEYTQSFLAFYPFISLILNIEPDHLDFFTGIDHIIETFRLFAALTPENGAIIANRDDKNVRRAIKGARAEVITFALSEKADFTARNISFDEGGCAAFDLVYKAQKISEVKLAAPGRHNILNALATLACANRLGLDAGAAAKGLSQFKGAHRRFERRGKWRGAEIIDDYAHHPTEIKATIETALRFCKAKLYIVFQPHTYTRTKALFDDFAAALTGDFEVIITDIYAAREKDNGLIHSKDLAGAIANARYIGVFSECAKYLASHVKENDVVITMGAGDIYTVGNMLLEMGERPDPEA